MTEELDIEGAGGKVGRESPDDGRRRRATAGQWTLQALGGALIVCGAAYGGGIALAVVALAMVGFEIWLWRRVHARGRPAGDRMTARCCICGCWVAGDAYGVDDGRRWCYGCFAGEQAHGRRGADGRLVEAAAAAAAALAATAFEAGWPDIPMQQPQWLRVQALATAALGDAAAGGELAQAFLCGEQEARINAALRELGYAPSVRRREGQGGYGYGGRTAH